MPLPGPTEKKKHWQDIVYTPIVSNPGVFDKPSITVNEFGLITAVVNQAISSIYVIDIPANLATIPGPQNGDLAIVRDDSTGSDPNSPEAMYVFDADIPHIGWRRIASTATQEQRMDYRQILFSTAVVNPLGAPVAPTAIVKEVAVTITTPYTALGTIDIRDSGGTIYMPSANINAQVAGTYTEVLSDNNTVVTGTQLEALIGGGPVAGNALVYIKYINT